MGKLLFINSTSINMGKDAKATARQVKKGSHTNSKRRVWTNTTFRRPVTTTQKQAPLALRHGVKNDKNVFNAYAIIKHPLASESAIQPIKVSRVNTLMRPDGEKKAYVTLGADQDALEA